MNLPKEMRWKSTDVWTIEVKKLWHPGIEIKMGCKNMDVLKSEVKKC